MKLKVLLAAMTVISVIAVIFYIIVNTAMNAFKICSEPLKVEFFADEKEEEILNRMQNAKLAQDVKIGEIGGKTNVDDPVSDAYLPYSFNVYNKQLPKADDIQAQNNYEYIITATYKKVLERNPTEDELLKNVALFKKGELNDELLLTYLYNSTEYSMKSRVQSNDVNNDLEYAYAKEDILSIIAKLYYGELHEEAPKKILLPLRDMFMYFDSDQYMFRAFLLADNYKNFENEVISSRRLKKENILDVYRKYFKEDELRYIANDIRRYDLLTKQNQNNKPPDNLPTNTNFQGADLGALEAGIGTGSGAVTQQPDKQLTVQDLVKALD